MARGGRNRKMWGHVIFQIYIHIERGSCTFMHSLLFIIYIQSLIEDDIVNGEWIGAKRAKATLQRERERG